MKKVFSHYLFKGTHYQAGCQYGEELRERINQHVALTYDLAYQRSAMQKDRALALSRDYIPYIEKYAPGFMDEIKGLAAGANLSMDEALLLQIRQEVVHSQYHSASECTSYAISGTYTADGQVYSGQNIDLSGDFESISNVITFEITGKPRIIMVCPSGQLSHVGMNEEGISCNCNFLSCNGWRKGFPRYLLSRLILEQRTFQNACERLEAVTERAASRNILIADRMGNIANYEMLTTKYGKLDVKDYCVHSNHFLVKDLLQYEASDSYEMEDSVRRYERLRELIERNKGAIDVAKIKSFLRDHGDGKEPYTICMHPTEHNIYHTVASTINRLNERIFEVAVGNPCEHEYAAYTL